MCRLDEYEEVYNNLKAEGHTDEEIAEAMMIPGREWTEEDSKALAAHRKAYWKQMGWKKRWYWKFKCRYLSYKFRFQDFKRRYFK